MPKRTILRLLILSCPILGSAAGIDQAGQGGTTPMVEGTVVTQSGGPVMGVQVNSEPADGRPGSYAYGDGDRRDVF